MAETFSPIFLSTRGNLGDILYRAMPIPTPPDHYFGNYSCLNTLKGEEKKEFWTNSPRNIFPVGNG